MNQVLPLSAKVLGGLFATAVFAFPQAYTISAKPGAVNYIEGNAQLDGQVLTVSSLKAVFMNAGSLLETRDGKAEVLLTPGIFLRIGDNSRVRMLKPSLVDTQIAIEAGESMIEVDQFVKESHITVSVHGALAGIEKNGLYRFRADGDASVAVMDGKLDVSFGEKHTSVGKGHEALLTDNLKVRDFNKNEPDELYAWSNIRAEYNASLTYQAARSAYSSGYGGAGGYGGNGYGGYGYGGYGGGFYGNGWYWSNGFNSWLWMPGGQYFSPFGWGFYGPGFVSYAPVVLAPVGGGGGIVPVKHPHPGPGNGVGVVTVPVNPKAPPAIGNFSASPAQYANARVEAAHAIASSGGFRTPSGASFSSSGGVRSSGGASSSSGHSSGGSFSSVGSSGSVSSGGGGGHSGGGGSSGGHGK